MKPFYCFFLLTFLCSPCFSQTNTVQQNASQAKDAQVDVTITDDKDNVLEHELVAFRSRISQKEFQGLSQANGKFSLRLPAGDKYDIYVLGFRDSTSYNVLEIPSLAPNTSFKKPFVINIKHNASKSFVLDGVNYETGKADLTPESFPVLDELVTYINRNKDDRLEIGGHTDNVGKPAANMLLSMERAKSVVAYLISKGVDTTKIVAKGYGSTLPIEENNTPEGRASNRRTEVKFLD